MMKFGQQSLIMFWFMVQPNFSHFSVASDNSVDVHYHTVDVITESYCRCFRTLRQSSSLSCLLFCDRIFTSVEGGGRHPTFTQQQEGMIVDMVIQSNTIRLREIQVTEDDVNFEVINPVSLSTTDHLLTCNRVTIEQVYRVQL